MNKILQMVERLPKKVEVNLDRTYLNLSPMQITTNDRVREIMISPLMMTPCLYIDVNGKYITDKYAIIFHYMIKDDSLMIDSGTKAQVLKAKDNGGVIFIDGKYLSLVLPSGAKVSVDYNLTTKNKVSYRNTELVCEAYMFYSILNNDIEYLSRVYTPTDKLYRVKVDGEIKRIISSNTNLPKVMGKKDDELSDLVERLKDHGGIIMSLMKILNYKDKDILSKLMLFIMMSQRTFTHSASTLHTMVLFLFGEEEGIFATLNSSESRELLESLYNYMNILGQVVYRVNKTK